MLVKIIYCGAVAKIIFQRKKIPIQHVIYLVKNENMIKPKIIRQS